ncbi:hypothetical protein O0L34_g8595 [Tuta absoluta]|nr:hypothetical protein O0L34_g8595 [Tuta absoluta]
MLLRIGKNKQLLPRQGPAQTRPTVGLGLLSHRDEFVDKHVVKNRAEQAINAKTRPGANKAYKVHVELGLLTQRDAFLDEHVVKNRAEQAISAKTRPGTNKAYS